MQATLPTSSLFLFSLPPFLLQFKNCPNLLSNYTNEFIVEGPWWPSEVSLGPGQNVSSAPVWQRRRRRRGRRDKDGEGANMEGRLKRGTGGGSGPELTRFPRNRFALLADRNQERYTDPLCVCETVGLGHMTLAHLLTADPLVRAAGGDRRMTETFSSLRLETFLRHFGTTEPNWTLLFCPRRWSVPSGCGDPLLKLHRDLYRYVSS